MGNSKCVNQESFFNFLYSSQFSKMRAYAFAIINDHALAEEIVQDSFVEVLIHIDQLMRAEKPEWWLQKTVKNKALHVQREQARSVWRLAALESEQLVDTSVSKQFQEIEEADHVGTIRDTIKTVLKPEDIRLLQQVAMEGATYKFISEQTGMSVSACQKRVQRIRRKLQKHISAP